MFKEAGFSVANSLVRETWVGVCSPWCRVGLFLTFMCSEDEKVSYLD